MFVSQINFKFKRFFGLMKNHLLKLSCLFFLLGFSSAYSQYTDVINSNKPGFSESPYSVGRGIYQFEGNLFLRNTSIEPTFSIPQSFGFDMLFRTSLLSEKLELNAQVSYQRDKIAFKNIFTSSYFSTGFQKITIGAKYLVFQKEYEDKSKEVRSWKKRHAFDRNRLIPSVAIYAGVNTDMENDIYKTGNMSPKIGILLQNNLSNDFNIITNLYYDKIGTDFSEFSYIITATQNFSDKWSGFFENQTVLQKYQNNTNLAAGLAYLINRDFQINTSVRILFEGKAEGTYGSLGISYRINKHKDSFVDLQESNLTLKGTPKTKYNNQKSFFRRIFSFLERKKNTKTIRKRPSRTRTKKITKNKKRGLFGLFGKKKRKEETEIEKLEREIKELEKEVKKDDH